MLVSLGSTQSETKKIRSERLQKWKPAKFQKRLLASWLKQLSKMFQLTNIRVNYAVLKKRDREGEREERGEGHFPLAPLY